MGYSVTIASVLLHFATHQLNFHPNSVWSRVEASEPYRVGYHVVRKTYSHVRSESIHGASRAAPLLKVF